MRQIFFNLFKHFSVYGIGQVAVKLIAIALIPLYTSNLSTAEYGILQICNIFGSILIIIINLGITSSLFKIYYNSDKNDHREKTITSAFVIYFINASIVLSLFWIFKAPLSKILIGQFPKVNYLYSIILIATFVEGFFNLELATLRAKEKSINYIVLVIFRMILYILLNLLFVLKLKRGYIGIREVLLISASIASILAIPFSIGKIKLKISKKIISELLEIGIPLAIGGVAVLFLNLTDRYMLKAMLPQEIALNQVGIYSLGDKFSMIIKFIIVLPFMTAWGAFMYKYQNDPKAKMIYQKVFHYFSFGIGFFILWTTILSPYLLNLLARQSAYLDAYKIVPFLTMSKTITGIYMIFTVGVTLTRNTKYMAYSNYFAAFINIVLNFMFIPIWEMQGAAIASLIAQAFRILFLYFYSQKVYYVNWKSGRVTLFFTFIFLISILSTFYLNSLILRILLLLTSSYLLFYFKIISFEEVKKIKQISFDKFIK